MATQTIQFQNKVALNTNPEIADINKVTDNDMNEIKSVVNNNANELNNTNNKFNNVILWEGAELPAGKTYTLTDNIFNYRLAIIEGQWGNKFVIPIISGNNYFNGGMNYPLGNGTAMATTGLNASIVNNGLGISVTYFRQLTHNQNSNHGSFENPQLYKIIGVK